MTSNLIGVDDPFNDYRSEQFLCGADCLNLKRYPEALDHFVNVLTSDNKDNLYYSAKLNSLTARQRINWNNDAELKLIIYEYEKLLNSSEDIVNKEIKLYTSYQLASLYLLKKDDVNAYKYFEIALQYVDNSAKLRVLVEMYYVTPNEQRTGLLNEIIGLIINLTSISTMLDPDNSLGTDESILKEHYISFIFTHTVDGRKLLGKCPY